MTRPSPKYGLTLIAFSLVTLIAGASSAGAAAGAPPHGTVYVAPNGLDTNLGTAAAPVLTLNRAYQLAKPGDTVEIGAGHYPAQILGLDRSKGSARRVTFRPAKGTAVSIDLIDFGQGQLGTPGPQAITLQDMSVTYLRAWAGTKDVIWKNIRGQHFDIFDAVNVRLIGGTFGPCQTPRDDPSCVPRIAGTASEIIIDGTTIQGMTSSDLASFHVDGLLIRGSSNVTIRHSRFYGNMITNIRVQNQECCINRRLTIANNWFAAPLQGDGVRTRADAIDIDNPVEGLSIRNNSFAPSAGIQLPPEVTPGSTRIVGNLMLNFPCASGVEYAYNVFIPFSPYTATTPCSRSDKRVASFGYASADGFDYHLKRGSPAIGRVPPKDCSGTDIDRQLRPRGARCDAGSDQHSIAVCPPKKARRVTRLVDPQALATLRKRGYTVGACKPRQH